MLHAIDWLRVFIFDHRSLEYIIIFFGAALGGELALFALGFITAQGIVPIAPVALLSFLGTFVPNILWFLLGKTNFISKIISHRYAKTTSSTIAKALARVSGGNHFIALILAKFIVGTPVVLVTYANKTDLTFREFLYYETPAIFLSVLLIIPIGYLSGLGFTYLAHIFDNLYVALGYIILILFFMVMLQMSFKKKFSSKK